MIVPPTVGPLWGSETHLDVNIDLGVYADVGVYVDVDVDVDLIDVIDSVKFSWGTGAAGL